MGKPIPTRRKNPLIESINNQKQNKYKINLSC